MPDDQPLEDDAETLRAELTALRSEKAGLELDKAMLSAGIDLESKTGQMFRRAWDGTADVEKIKLEAAEIPGALKATPAPAPSDEVQREAGEDSQFSERAALTNEAPAGAEDPDPKTETYGALDLEIQRGARVEDAMGNALQKLVHAANSGDDRVLVTRNR